MSEKIPLYTLTSYDWYNKFQQNNKPYAVNTDVGINEYTFGRTTPDNKFIVASGLVMNKQPYGIEMVGGNNKLKLKLNNNKQKKNLNKSIMENKISQIMSQYKMQNGGKKDKKKEDKKEKKLQSGGKDDKKKDDKKKDDKKEKKLQSGGKDDKKKDSKNKDNKKKNSKKVQKGGLMQFLTTPQFGLNPGVGDQMASNSDMYNPLLKQQKSTGQHLNTIFGDNGGVADQIASNDLPGYDKGMGFSSIGGAKGKKLKKKVMKKSDPKKKMMKKSEPKKKMMKKSEPKKKMMKKSEPKKKTTIKNFFKKLL